MLKLTLVLPGAFVVVSEERSWQLWATVGAQGDGVAPGWSPWQSVSRGSGGARSHPRRVLAGKFRGGWGAAWASSVTVPLGRKTQGLSPHPVARRRPRGAWPSCLCEQEPEFMSNRRACRRPLPRAQHPVFGAVGKETPPPSPSTLGVASLQEQIRAVFV